MVQDDGYFVRKSRVVADAVGNGGGQHVAVAIFVLQAFAIECGAPAGAAQQEAACLHVASRPCQIARALETKHGVEGVKRHHDAVAGAVAGGCGYPACHSTCFVDAFLQNLAVVLLFVVHDLVAIHRRVELALRVVDTNLPKQPFHAKSAGFVHQNRHYARAYFLLAQQLR